MEEWKDVLGYEGVYAVNRKGVIKRVDKNKIVTQYLHYKGYLQVDLHKDNKRIHKYVHRIVAEAFIENPNNYTQINHIDENKTNNNVENLEWCTPKYNMNYGTRIKRQVKSARKIPVMCVETGKKYEALSYTKKDGFHYGHVKECCLDENKTHKGYHWRFLKE